MGKIFGFIYIIIIGFIQVCVSAFLVIEPGEQEYGNNCIVSKGIFLDTRGEEVIGIELLLNYNKEEIEILGIEDLGLFEMPIGSKHLSVSGNIFYYSTTNLGKKYFKGNARIGNLIFKSKNNITGSRIDFMYTLGSTNDTNVVSKNLNDILSYAQGQQYKFNKEESCQDIEANVFVEPNFENIQDVEYYIENHIKSIKIQEKNILNKYGSIILIILITLFFIVIIYNYRKNKRQKKNKKTNNLKIVVLIIFLFIFKFGVTLGAGEENAQGRFWYEDPLEVPKMYCLTTIDIMSDSIANINIDGQTNWKIESFNPIFLHNPNTTDGFMFDFAGLKGTLYHGTNAYYTLWPQADFDNRKASMLAGYFIESQLPGIEYLVGKVKFWSKYGTLNTITGINLGFYIDKNNNTNDSNIPISVNSRDILFSAPQKNLELSALPCIQDTQKPTININNIQNGAYRVQDIPIEFIVSDVGVKHIYPWGSEPGTFAFKSLNRDNVGIDNYDLNTQIDNQYGINSGSIYISVNGIDKTDFVNLAWNGYKNRRFEDTKGFMGNLVDSDLWNIEEEITVQIYAKDMSPRENNNSISISFNSPKPFELENYSQYNTNIDPDLNEISFSVYDDRAGVDTDSLYITIRTGSVDGPILNSGNAIFDINNINILKYEKTFLSNGLLGSNSMTHDKNYHITLSGFGKLPENQEIYVVVSGFDLAYRPNASKKYFSFFTRQKCEDIQCGEGTNIYTGGIYSINSFFYTQNNLIISGGNNPYIQGNKLFCNPPIRLDIYENSTLKINQFSGEILNIQILNGGTAELIGNTIYVKKSQQTTNPGAGVGISPITKDNCLLPYSNLLGANYLGIDYSNSYYDNDCGSLETQHPSPIRQCNLSNEHMDEIEKAYLYACKLGITSINNIEEARLYDNIIRIDLAKMLVIYAQNVLNLKTDKTKTCYFDDMQNFDEKSLEYANMVCQLGLMGLEYNGEPAKNFMPNDFVDKAQLGTIVSRLLWGNKYNGNANNWYIDHLNALFDARILDSLENHQLLEKRWNIMIMLKRADNTNYLTIYKYEEKIGNINTCSVSKLGEELEKAYLYACELGITTMENLEDARMYDKISRQELAKMISVYAIEVIGISQDNTKKCIYNDIEDESEEMKKYIELSCQLGLMGLEYDGEPAKNFNPQGTVDRAQFGTVLSRLIYGEKYNGDKEIWYRPHLDILNKDGIMKKIDSPLELEIRGYVMLMMQRAQNIILYKKK